MAPEAASAPSRAVRAAAWYLRRNPLTATYLAVLLALDGLVGLALPPATTTRLLRYVSTNLDNLERHPLASLLGSALFLAGSLTDPDTVMLVAAGIGVCMAWVERRRGAARAAAIFLAGHVGATLATVPVILYGISTGRYRPSDRHAFDFGVSYGAITMAAAVTRYLPRRVRWLWAAALPAYLLQAATWSGFLPDFTTVGHLAAAAIGFAVAAWPATPRASRPTRQPGAGIGSAGDDGHGA
jgi:hypothetical protein